MDKEPADVFAAGGDVEEKATPAEAMGHETLTHHKARLEVGHTDAELLKEEGADLPHDTMAGHVRLHGPADPEV